MGTKRCLNSNKRIIKVTMSSVDYHPTPANIPCILHNQHLLQRKNRIKTRTRLIGLSLRLHKVSVVKKVTKEITAKKVRKAKKVIKAKKVNRAKKVRKAKKVIKAKKVTRAKKVTKAKEVIKVTMVWV